jgi:hypothetical protein
MQWETRGCGSAWSHDDDARLDGDARQGDDVRLVDDARQGDGGDSSISHVLLSGTVLSSFPLLSVPLLSVARAPWSFLGLVLRYGS